MSLQHTGSPEDTVAASVDRDLQFRIQTEFEEMPGLRLTLPQAARLFDTDTPTCQRALIRLIAAGVLSVDEGSFVLRLAGRLH